MAGYLNKAQLIGNLGADPEVRSFQSGGKVATFRVATSESWKDKDTGERKERTEWHTIQVFNEGLISVVERFLRKGSKVFVEGQIRTRKWQDQSGNDRYSTEIALQGFDAKLVLLDKVESGASSSRYDGQPGPGNSGGGSSTEPGNSGGGGAGGYSGGGFVDDLDDDIPF